MGNLDRFVESVVPRPMPWWLLGILAAAMLLALATVVADRGWVGVPVAVVLGAVAWRALRELRTPRSGDPQ